MGAPQASQYFLATERKRWGALEAAGKPVREHRALCEPRWSQARPADTMAGSGLQRPVGSRLVPGEEAEGAQPAKQF